MSWENFESGLAPRDYTDVEGGKAQNVFLAVNLWAMLCPAAGEDQPGDQPERLQRQIGHLEFRNHDGTLPKSREPKHEDSAAAHPKSDH